MKLTKIEKVDDYDFKEIYHVDAQGRKQGKYIRYRPDGSKSVECNYKDNKKHRQYLSYYPDGSKDLVCNYKDGKHHGKFVAYNPDGSKYLECNYKDGKKHGKEISYYRNGIKSEERISKDGKILKSTYYNENGQKVEERKYFYPEGDKK